MLDYFNTISRNFNSNGSAVSQFRIGVDLCVIFLVCSGEIAVKV